MAYVTPKTNWASTDGVTAADLNRIEGNINDLNAVQMPTKVGHIESGKKLVIVRVTTGTYTANANSSVQATTSYGYTFSAAPHVAITPVASGNAYGITPAPASVGVSSVDIWVYNNSTAVRYVLLHVIAIGPA